MTTQYDWSDPASTLDTIKNRILVAMKKEEIWYTKFRRSHAVYSRLLRILSLILFAIGILCPIAESVCSYTEGSSIGYLSLAVGGFLLLLDKYLGVSSSFVRFYVAELDIQKNTQEFIENWDIEAAKSSNPLTKENIVSFLTLVKTFRLAVYNTIQVETGAWASEFQTQTGELYELFKQKEDIYKRPGNISVSITNYETYDDIKIGLDVSEQLGLDGPNSTIFRSVSPGPHVLVVKALKKNQPISFSTIVVVEPDKTLSTNIPFPV